MIGFQLFYGESEYEEKSVLKLYLVLKIYLPYHNIVDLLKKIVRLPTNVPEN